MDSDYIFMGSEYEASTYEQSRGKWIVADVRQSIGWPEKKVLIVFRGTKVLLFPEEDNKYPSVAVLIRPDLPEENARKLILHFLSSLAWAESRGIEVLYWGGGSRPYRMSKSKFMSIIRPKFRITYLPDPADDDTRLALAFYREALSLEHLAYSFLSYYKIINMRYKRGDRQKAWIRRSLERLNDRDAEKRLTELRSEQMDVADYLYNSCRCAIAHAGVNPTVDPENVEDRNRLNLDLPLIKSLAELLIEEHFGVKKPGTIRRDHLYELSGFKGILDDKIIEKIKQGNADLPHEINMIDFLSVRLWDKRKFAALEKMQLVEFRYGDGILVIDCASENHLVLIALGLDFKNERLLFDPVNGIATSDDGTAKAAQFAADIQEFLCDYYGNGSLEVWDPENEICLGRCNPFIPSNIDMRKTRESFEQAKLHCLKVAEKRKEKSNNALAADS
jgi:hypothetical protein